MFDFEVVNLILAGWMGLTVVGVTEAIKRFLKASGVFAVLISVAVSAAGTAYYLISTATFALVPFIGYTLLTAAVANGIFKAVHTPSNPT